MGMGFAPTWLRQVSPPPPSHDHFNHWEHASLLTKEIMIFGKIYKILRSESWDRFTTQRW